MKKIALTRGLYALVDDDDFEELNKWKWHARKGRYTWYASRKIMQKNSDGKWVHKKLIHMHRVVNKTPNSLFTDHINGNGLDNRKSNLRSATNSQNLLNSRVRVDNSSGVRGISWHKTRKKWRVYISDGGRHRHIGLFSTLDEAIEARKQYLGS
mgnify:CR=1 FL=1